MALLNSILVIDDSKTIRASVQSMMRKHSIEVHTAEDGYLAMTAILANRPDLVLVDALMPRINGYQVIRLLKSNPNYMALPVVMLTGKNRIIDKERAFLCGADAFLPKPFTESDMLSTLRQFALLPTAGDFA
ncbi:response regulator [Azonexus hydrophilus]|uniref:Response regulator n=1 Tax=Azonexus hydrophilus TaxID=418702 RepID=A0ABZ2XLA3_9RHOO